MLLFLSSLFELPLQGQIHPDDANLPGNGTPTAFAIGYMRALPERARDEGKD
jgi:hypothetical protein